MKTSLIIEYVNPITNDVSFAVLFTGYTTDSFFYGKRSSAICINDTRDDFVKIALPDCTYNPKSTSYSLSIDEKSSFEKDPRVNLLSPSDSLEVIATLDKMYK